MKLTPEQIEALKKRFEENLERAQVEGLANSDYFLDKCGAEAGGPPADDSGPEEPPAV